MKINRNFKLVCHTEPRGANNLEGYNKGDTYNATLHILKSGRSKIEISFDGITSDAYKSPGIVSRYFTIPQEIQKTIRDAKHTQ